jgi:hypothetical protein
MGESFYALAPFDLNPDSDPYSHVKRCRALVWLGMMAITIIVVFFVA